MRPPKATDREKKIWVAASSHTWGFFSTSHCSEHTDHTSGHCVCDGRSNLNSPAAAKGDQTHIGSEEVQQSITGSGQREGTNQENGKHQVREGGRHIHSLLVKEFKKTLPGMIQWTFGVFIFFNRDNRPCPWTGCLWWNRCRPSPRRWPDRRPSTTARSHWSRCLMWYSGSRGTRSNLMACSSHTPHYSLRGCMHR